MNTKSKLAIETLSTMKEKIIDNINNSNSGQFEPINNNSTDDSGFFEPISKDKDILLITNNISDQFEPIPSSPNNISILDQFVPITEEEESKLDMSGFEPIEDSKSAIDNDNFEPIDNNGNFEIIEGNIGQPKIEIGGFEPINNDLFEPINTSSDNNINSNSYSTSDETTESNVQFLELTSNTDSSILINDSEIISLDPIKDKKSPKPHPNNGSKRFNVKKISSMDAFPNNEPKLPLGMKSNSDILNDLFH